MRHFLTILAALFLCAAPAQAQTMKSLMFNSTNGQVVANTGANSLKLKLENGVEIGNDIGSVLLTVDASGVSFYDSAWGENVLFLPYDGTVQLNDAWNTPSVRASLGFSTNLSSLWLATNAAEARNAIGAGTGSGGAGGVDLSTTNATGVLPISKGGTSATNAIGIRQAIGLQSYTNILTNSVNDVEIGSTVSAVTIGWTIAPTDASYAVRTLVGESQTNSITNNSSTLARTGLTLTSNTTWTLTVGDGFGVTNTTTTAVNFLNYMSWGRSTNTTLSNAAIQTLHTNGGNRVFATSRNRSFSVDGGGQFIFIAYPAGFGSASFTVGGLPNTAFTLTTNSYTNANNYVTNYLIYRTDTIQNGTGINFVVQ